MYIDIAGASRLVVLCFIRIDKIQAGASMAQSSEQAPLTSVVVASLTLATDSCKESPNSVCHSAESGGFSPGGSGLLPCTGQVGRVG
jgi:hypothetical protein